MPQVAPAIETFARIKVVGVGGAVCEGRECRRVISGAGGREERSRSKGKGGIC